MFEKMPLLIEKPEEKEALEPKTEKILLKKEKEIITNKSEEIKGEKRRKFVKKVACLLAGLMLSSALAFDEIKVKADVNSLKEIQKMEEVLTTENEEEQIASVKQEIKEFNQELQVLPEEETEEKILYQIETSQPSQSTSEVLKSQYQETGSLPNEGMVRLTGGGTETNIVEGTTDKVLSGTISSLQKYQVKKIEPGQNINWLEEREVQGYGSNKSEAITEALRNASYTFMKIKGEKVTETKGQATKPLSTEIKSLSYLTHRIVESSSYFKYKVIEEKQEKNGIYEVKLEINRGKINL